MPSHKDPLKRKEYQRKYMREIWYPKNKKKHLCYLNTLKKRILAYIHAVKTAGVCIDCSYKGKAHPEVLDFDHKKDKKFDIGNCLRFTVSLSKVIKEIKKCDLVCANCHRIRTFKDRSYLSKTR